MIISDETMKPIIYVCNETGKIIEKSGPIDYGSAHGFLVVKKYPVLYAENLSRFNCMQQIYGLPFGKVDCAGKLTPGLYWSYGYKRKGKARR